MPSMTCSIPPPPVLSNDRHPIAPLKRAQSEKSRPACRDRLLGRGHREMDEPAHPPGHLAVHRDRRVEVLDLGRDPDVEAGWIEGGDRSCAGDAFEEIRPERGGVVADRRHGAEAGHDGSVRRVSSGWQAGSPLLGPWAGGDCTTPASCSQFERRADSQHVIARSPTSVAVVALEDDGAVVAARGRCCSTGAYRIGSAASASVTTHRSHSGSGSR